MSSHKLSAFCLCLLLFAPLVFAKDKKQKPEPPMVIFWPDQANPTLKLTFEKFTEMAAYNGQRSLGSHVLVENLSGKRIPQASFTVYLMDQNKVRIGNGNLSFSDLDAGQQAMLAFQVFSVGTPASLSLVARNDTSGIPTSLKTVPLKVITVPPGATLKVDGRDEGITPATVRLTVGNQCLLSARKDTHRGIHPSRSSRMRLRVAASQSIWADSPATISNCGMEL